jgi:RNA polymerase sigma-B factor
LTDAKTEYADVGDMFRRLESLDPGSPAYQRQRDRIIARTLPIADHIARRFRSRGEPLDDLTQVARVGLVSAVQRFDLTIGTDFVGFAVPTIMGEVRRHFRDHGWPHPGPRER